MDWKMNGVDMKLYGQARPSTLKSEFLKQYWKDQCQDAVKFTNLARDDFGQLAEGSLIFPPFRCENPAAMFFGRVAIYANGWMGAVEKYAGAEFNPRLEIGDGTRIGRGVHLFCCLHMVIGRNVLIADNVYISDNLHGYENIDLPPSKQPLITPGPVSIGDETWIGERVCVLPNVAIGKHCVIGAAAVVKKDIPDYCVAAGVPAKIIKRYDFDGQAWVWVSGA